METILKDVSAKERLNTFLSTTAATPKKTFFWPRFVRDSSTFYVPHFLLVVVKRNEPKEGKASQPSRQSLFNKNLSLIFSLVIG